MTEIRGRQVKKVLCACFILAGWLFWQPGHAQERCNNAQGCSSLTLEELLKQPQAYQGKIVRVSGFLHCRFEDMALYLARDDSDKNVYRHALWITCRQDVEIKLLVPGEGAAKLQDLDARHVEMVGEFRNDMHGHFGVYAAGLKDVRSVRQHKD
jgi:hypothetical protein